MGFAAGFMSPVLSGLVLEHLGWQWIFNIIAIFTSVGLLTTFLFVPETTYHRNNDSSNITHEPATAAVTTSVEDGTVVESRHRMKFPRRLLPIQRRISNENFAMLLLRPLLLIFHPAVLWVDFPSSSASRSNCANTRRSSHSLAVHLFPGLSSPSL